MNKSRTNRLFLIFTAVILVHIFPVGISGQIIPDVPTEDAPAGDTPVKKAESGKDQSSREKGKSKTEIESRMFSIGTFSYAPITDTSHLGVVNGLFEEKSASALLNAEFVIHPEQPKNRSMVFKLDVEAMVSSLYQADSPFFEKAAGDWVRLDEFFWEASPAPWASFLIGKYRHIFTPGLFQNPLDRFNPTSTLPGEPAQREGAWISELSFDGDFKLEMLSRFRVSFAFLPSFFLNKYGLPVWDRTVMTLNPASPLGFSQSREDYTMDFMGGFARLYFDVLKGDFNVIYYYTEKQNQGGFSYSRYFFNTLEWHGEILFYDKPHSNFVVADTSRDYYVDALTGLRLDVGDSTSFSFEYLYRRENPESYPEGLADQKRIWLGQLGTESTGHALTPLRHYLIFSFLSSNIKDILDLALNVVVNPVDTEYLLSLRTDLKLDKSSKISAAGTFKIADSGTFYGEFLPFDYQLRLEYYIAFF